MHIIAFVIVMVCGVLGMVLFDSAFLGALLGLGLCFLGLIAIIAMPSKKEAEKNKARKKEDNGELQGQWNDKDWIKANATNAYQNRRALSYFGDTVDNPGTPKSNKRLVALFWGFCGFSCVIAVAMLSMAFYAALIFLALAAGFGGFARYLQKSYPKKYVLWLKAVNYNFLEECWKADIDDLKTRKSVARMCLIAEKVGLEGTEEELVKRFHSATAEYFARQEVLVDRSEVDRIDALLEKDQEEVEKINRYLSFTGREKTVRMCRDKAQEYLDKAEKYRRDLQDVYAKYGDAQRAFSQREHDWASAGGAASAIAGPVAGVATAVDLQLKNAQIREHNAQVSSMVSGVAVNEVTPILDKISKAEAEAAKWQQRAEAVQDKLIEELPGDRLLALLNPVVKSTEVNDAGTLRIKVDVQGAKATIYDNVPAVADGAIRAVLQKGGETIGDAVLLLPYNGAFRKQTLTGICLDAPEETDIESIVFEPVKLWAIEK